MMQRLLSSVFACLLFSNNMYAQTAGSLDGEWQFAGVSTEYVRVEGNNVTIFQKGDDGLWKALDEYASSGTTRKKTYVVHDNNLNVSVIESKKKEGTTTTHTINMFYVSPFVALGHDIFYTNRIKESRFPEQSWHWGDSSKSSYSYELDVMVPRILKKFTLSSSMASTSPYITLDEAFNTARYTVLKFTVANETDQKQSFTLNPPGDENAFFLTDMAGKNYKMQGQFGFGEYKTYTYNEDDKVVFYVFFDKIPDNTKRITIREGACTEGCWNFYDVSLD